MEDKKVYRAHVLVLPYPSQGHINPMLQFSKRLASKGLKLTFAITLFISKSFNVVPEPSGGSAVVIETISDGYDDGGFAEAESIHAYLKRMEACGSKTLTEIITKHRSSSNPIDCILYDPFLYWALDVVNKFGLVGAAFFTQPCAVNYVYYLVHHGLLKLPIVETPVSIPGLPMLELQDMPSFIYHQGQYPAYFDMLLNQFSNADKAHFALVNTFYDLEQEVVDSMSKFCPLLTIGPTVPSFYLDNRVQNDKDNDLNLYKLLDPSICTNWLNTKPERSVVYVSFGSMACLSNEQMEELAWGLKQSNFYFLWVVRASEEPKLPKQFIEEIADKGLLVRWSPQLEVLSNKALGCFFSHAGWNSSIEALCLEVPMVVMPQWTDQPMNAKCVEDVWKVGIRVRVDEDGIVRRKEIENCIREVMEGEKGREMRRNSKKWRELAIKAVSEGGTTDKNIDEFVSKLTNFKQQLVT
ncbi:hypothetical protein Dsin_020138 [Dipteronia sinensis]|uniref:Glycosyltransferase n=1 Tax=Dipteronia sinensis TaxID=43782 RepID=A0AAE0A934_9ROSI|nr:hypothetical protein Dsin_020138 [Dipteronia sinensis]